MNFLPWNDDAGVRDGIGKKKRIVYDVWESESNFCSFVNFVCSRSSGLKRIFPALGMIFARYTGKIITGKL